MPLPDDARHSPDFSSVLWNGLDDGGLDRRERVTHALWNAFETGLPEVHAAVLIEAAGSRLRKNALGPLFSRNTAWMTMIVRCRRRGFYRLNPDAPDESVKEQLRLENSCSADLVLTVR